MPRRIGRDTGAPDSEPNDWFKENETKDFKARIQTIFQEKMEKRLEDPSDEVSQTLRISCAVVSICFLFMICCICIAVGIWAVRSV